MTISPVSHSNYQNTINIRKNNNLQDNPQIPENQLAFKGLEKVVKKAAPSIQEACEGMKFAYESTMPLSLTSNANVEKAKEVLKALKAKGVYKKF